MNKNETQSGLEAGTGEVQTDECLDILREIVIAADPHRDLRRVLIDPYQPETRLSAWKLEVPPVLIERAMKALGQPYPSTPKPRKIPNPTAAQAQALEALARTEGDKQMRLVSWRGWSFSAHGYYVETPGAGDNLKVQKVTFNALLDYKWIGRLEGESTDARYTYFGITDAGREVLVRYQAKRASAVGGDNSVAVESSVPSST